MTIAMTFGLIGKRATQKTLWKSLEVTPSRVAEGLGLRLVAASFCIWLGLKATLGRARAAPNPPRWLALLAGFCNNVTTLASQVLAL